MLMEALGADLHIGQSAATAGDSFFIFGSQRLY